MMTKFKYFDYLQNYMETFITEYEDLQTFQDLNENIV